MALSFCMQEPKTGMVSTQHPS